MFKLATFLVILCISNAFCGIVDNVKRCGGLGTPLQLRVSECDGYCRFKVGSKYDAEKDFIPSSAAPSLSLRMDICYLGFCYVFLETVLSNSSVQPGLIYTAKYSIVPNDILQGNTIELHGYLFHSDNELVEVCVAFEAEIY